MSIISVKDMCLWYGDHQALKNVNIEIPERSITALIGPSGCGKTTLLRILGGFLDADEGSVMFDGEEISKEEASLEAPNTEISE